MADLPPNPPALGDNSTDGDAPATPATEEVAQAAAPAEAKEPEAMGALEPSLRAGTPAEAILPGGVLHEAFKGPTWARHIACLLAAWGEDLTPEQDRLFREVADGRNPPTKPVKEFWMIAGRGGGKDSIASAIATCAALRDYREHMRPGERATVMCLACDREQADIVRRYIAGYFNDYPELKVLVARETAEGLELTNGVEIVVATNSFRTVRGRTIVCAILDETAFYSDLRSASPDLELYAALQPALTRIPGSILVGISSPYRRQGLLYEVWQKYFGKDDPDILVVQGTTRQFNEKYPQATIDAELERDPERAGAERLAQWRDDLSMFLDRELVESAVDEGVTVRAPRQGVEYMMFTDAAGGRGDSFTAAVVHQEDDISIIDALYEAKPPFNPVTVIDEVAELARRYSVATMEGDDYAADILASMVAQAGINYVRTKRDKSATYLEALPLFTSRRARILDDRRMVHQLVSLDRRTSPGGRDKVTHPDRMHDDLANVVCGALVMAATDKRPSIINYRRLAKDDAIEPKNICGVIACLWDAGPRYAWVVCGLYDGYLSQRGNDKYLVLAADEGVGTSSVVHDVAKAMRQGVDVAPDQGFQNRGKELSALLFCHDQIRPSADQAIALAFSGARRGPPPGAIGFLAEPVAWAPQRSDQIGERKAVRIEDWWLSDPDALARSVGMLVDNRRVNPGPGVDRSIFRYLALRGGENLESEPMRMAQLVCYSRLLPDWMLARPPGALKVKWDAKRRRGR